MKAQQGKQYSGRLTAGAKKRLTKAITLMVQGTRRRWIFNPVTKRQTLHQLTFVTLTVSHTDKLTGKEAYKNLLSPFLSWLRKTKGVNTYIWKAELQRNGQIHYHVTMPDFIHYQELREKWNAIQKKAGIIDKYRAAQLAWHKDGFRVREHLLKTWSLENQKKAYAKGMETDWQDPNSTDVHKVYKMKDVTAYLVKEIAKQMQNETSLGGKVWDCSAQLSKQGYFSTYMKDEQYIYLENAVNERLATKYEAERFTIYRFNEIDQVQERLLTDNDLKLYKVWLKVLQDSIAFNDPPGS